MAQRLIEYPKTERIKHVNDKIHVYMHNNKKSNVIYLFQKTRLKSRFYFMTMRSLVSQKLLQDFAVITSI